MGTVFPGRHRPHEVMVLVWSAAICVIHFVTGPTPNSLDEAFPPIMVTAWYLLNGAGGLAGLVGVLWRNIIVGLHLERAGMVACAAAVAMYALAAFYVAGWRAASAGGLIACWAAACVWRAGQITLDLRRVAR